MLPFEAQIRSHVNRLTKVEHAELYRRRELVLVLIAIFVISTIYLIARRYLLIMDVDPEIRLLLPERLIQVGTLLFFILTAVSLAVTLASNLFFDEQLNLFLITPISPFRFFLTKTAEALLEVSMMLVVLALPALFAFTQKVEAPLYFLPGTIVIFFLAVLSVVGLCYAAAFAGVTVLSALWLYRRVTLAVLAGSAITALFSLLQHTEATPPGRRTPLHAILAFLDTDPNFPWSPSRWASDAILSLGNLSPHPLAPSLAALVLSTLGSLGLAFFVFETWTLDIRSRASSLSLRGRQNNDSEAHPSLTARLFKNSVRLLMRPNPLRGIIHKDLVCLIRDRGQAFQLFLYFVSSFGYLIMFKFLGRVVHGDRTSASMSFDVFLNTLNVMFTAFVLCAMMTRLVFPSVSLEGRALWILQVAPLSLASVLRAKVWAWLPVAALLAVTLTWVGASATGFSVVPTLVMTLVSLAYAWGFTTLAVGFGALFARFDSATPHHLSMSLGGMALLVTGLLMILSCLFPIMVLLAASGPLQHTPTRLGLLVASGCGVALIVTVPGFFALLLGRRSLRKFDYF